MVKITTQWRKSADIYPIRDIRVIDGDALEATIQLAFGAQVTKRIRLKGWWADELSGPWAASGKAAKDLLGTWVKDKALWILTPSQRMDRYGRVLACLLHHEKIVSPIDVLGSYQLTESEHKYRRDVLTNSQAVPGGSPKHGGSIRTAGTQSKSPISHPRAILDLKSNWQAQGWPCSCGPEGTHQGLECCPCMEMI